MAAHQRAAICCCCNRLRPNTVTTAYILLLLSRCFSLGHRAIATLSFAMSQKQECVAWIPAPFFWTIRHETEDGDSSYVGQHAAWTVCTPLGIRLLPTYLKGLFSSIKPFMQPSHMLSTHCDTLYSSYVSLLSTASMA